MLYLQKTWFMQATEENCHPFIVSLYSKLKETNLWSILQIFFWEVYREKNLQYYTDARIWFLVVRITHVTAGRNRILYVRLGLQDNTWCFFSSANFDKLDHHLFKYYSEMKIYSSSLQVKQEVSIYIDLKIIYTESMARVSSRHWHPDISRSLCYH